MVYAAAVVERAMKMHEVILRALSGALTWLQAADILGLDPRTVRRWRARFEANGALGLYDRRRQPSRRHAPAVVSEHDENKEDAQARGWDREEIEGDQIADMVGEERPPGLRRQGAPLRHEPRDGALGDVDAQREELAVDPGCAP